MTAQRSKHSIIIWFMAAAGAILVLRLFTLTIIESEKWTSYAEDMSMRVVYETGPRGDITDRNGTLLASSRAVYSVNISKVDMDRKEALASAEKVLEIISSCDEEPAASYDDVKESLEDTGYMSYMPVMLAGDISAETAEKIQEAEYPGIMISKNYIREYPQGALASHVIGYLGRISENEEKEYVEEKGYRADAMIGKSGVEKLCEDRLRGADAASRLQVDSRGNVTKLLDKSRVHKGKNVRLTLDAELQKTTEESLEKAIEQASLGGVFESRYGNVQMSYAPKASSGAAVALDVDTGQVLAMASSPDFDPNDFAEGISGKKWRRLQQENPNDPMSPAPMYNIATMSAVQPGSTFKPVTALAALSCGLDRERALYDKGYVSAGDRTFGCFLWNDSRATHGYTDLEDAMKVSCNYYFFDIATGTDLASGRSLGYDRKITAETVTDFAGKLGLGEKTGIELEESAGVRPSEELKRRGTAAALKEHLMKNCEKYFKDEVTENAELLKKKTEKIVNQSDKDLTLEEIIGKLKKEKGLKRGKIRELAELCKYTYFDRMKWTMGDTLNTSIGQGDNGYTAVQMANYMATMGNGGTRNRVSLLYDKEAEDGRRTGIRSEDIDTVLEAMTAVTSKPGGSLYGTFSSLPYAVAAKTGTAQRAGKINTTEEREYLRRYLHLIAPDVTLYQIEKEAERLMRKYPEIYDSEGEALHKAVMDLSDMVDGEGEINRYKESYDSFAWTVALAPADDPQIAVAVMIVQGKTAHNAAPVAREIIGSYGESSRWEKLF